MSHAAFLPAWALWSVMSAVMMLPLAVPWLVAVRRLAPGRSGGRAGAGAPGLDDARHGAPWGGRLRGMGTDGAGAPLGFAAGYLLAWAGFSAGAAGLQSALATSDLFTGGARLGEAPGGAALVAAGLYQLTPLKEACLRLCRNPLSLLLSRWRDGPAGAVRMGLEHGLHCVGCCWALMLLALVLGAMNLVWMAVLTAVVAVEKLAPGGERLGRLAGVAFVVWGTVRALAA